VIIDVQQVGGLPRKYLQQEWLGRLTVLILAVAGCRAMDNAAEAQVPFSVPRPPPGSPLPGIEEQQQPRLAPPLPLPARPEAPKAAPEGEARAITGVKVDGVTAPFPPAEITKLTAGLVGERVFTGQIEASRRALVDLYRSQGYVYVTVRAVIDGTELRFRVTEGFVAEVKLDHDVGPAGTLVLGFLNHVVDEVPLKVQTLEKWLLLAQEIPGLTVRSVLNPSLDDPGRLTLVAQVSRKPISGYVSADNRAFNLTGPSEGLGVVNFDSFTQFGERTQLSMFGAFNGTNIFGQASEELFLGSSGLKLKLYGGAGNSTPSGSLAAIGYNGATDVFGGLLSYPLLRARAQSLNLTAAFDAIESDASNTIGVDGSKQRASFDSIRVLRAGADYALLDTVFGPERSAVNTVSGKLSQGLTWLGASKDGDITTPPPRLGEKIDFTKFSGQVSRTQPLFTPFSGATVALAATLAGQYSNDLMPPAEKFYLGGPSFNRGYYYGQVSGDKALTFDAELQLNTPLPMPKPIPWDVRSQFYAFYDWGAVWQNTKLEADVTLRSGGVGVRFYVASSTEIDFEGAYRINVYPNGQGADISPLKSAAFYWQVLQRF
jgi:hemolysin activation/secretion protein